MKRFSPPLAIWIACLGLFLVFLGMRHAVVPPSHIAFEAPVTPHQVTVKKQEKLLPYPLDYGVELDEGLARPLFSETRRVPSGPGTMAENEQDADEIELFIEDPPDPPEIPREAELRGYMYSAGQEKALIAYNSSDEGVWFSVGDYFQGWQVLVVEKNAVHLGQLGFLHVIKVSR